MTQPSNISGKPGRGRRQLILLFTIFVLPVVIAYLLFVSGWHPDQTRNYGELVKPPRPVGEVSLTGADGKAASLEDFRGKWLYIYFGPASCPSVCMSNLYKMRQVRAAQAKEAPRIERVFVVTNPDGMDTLAGRLSEHPGLHWMTGKQAALAALGRAFELPGSLPLGDSGRIYVVDPLGNFMMSYPSDADPNLMRKDMARLLHVSQVG